MTKMRQDNDVTDHTCPLNGENEIELSWSIWQGMIYDEDQIG